MTLYEINDATAVINNVVRDDADVIIGTAINEAFQNEIQITVIATGFSEKPQTPAIPRMSAAEYFQGKPSTASASSSESTTSTSSSGLEFPKMPDLNLDVPDFLKKE